MKLKLLFTSFSGFAFIILIALSIYFFPGPYSFYGDYLSTLGVSVVDYYYSNVISLSLFAIAVTIVGIGIIIYSLNFPRLFSSKRISFFTYPGAFFGIIAGITFAQVGVTPYNLFMNLHLAVFFINIIAYLLMYIFFAIAIILEKKYPNIYAFFFFAVSLLILVYIAVMIWGTSSSMARVQTFCVVAMLGILIIQPLGSLKFYYSKNKQAL